MERQGTASKKIAPGKIERHVSLFGVMAGNAAQAAQFQRALTGLAMTCATNVAESAAAVQAEIARMTIDAVLHGDPGALMSLGERAARTGFSEGMECAARNLRAAQSAGSQILDTLSTPSGAASGTP